MWIRIRPFGNMRYSVVKQYEFREYILHKIAEQLRLSYNYVIREPC